MKRATLTLLTTALTIAMVLPFLPAAAQDAEPVPVSRTLPYLQRPAQDEMTITWFTTDDPAADDRGAPDRAAPPRTDGSAAGVRDRAEEQDRVGL